MNFISVVLVAAILLARNVAAFTPTSGSSVRSGATNLCMRNALIIQNKGGGHGELGMYFLVLLFGR